MIQVYFGAPDLEFVWVGDNAIDPLQQARRLQTLVGAGIRTRDEARAERGRRRIRGAVILPQPATPQRGL